MANVVQTGTFTEKDINDGKPLAAVGYFPLCGMPTFLIPMLAAKENPYAQFHARQAATLYITLLGSMIALVIVHVVLTIVLAFVSQGLANAVGCIFSVAEIALGGCCFVLMIIGIINALQGQAKEIPVLGPYSAKLPF